MSPAVPKRRAPFARSSVVVSYGQAPYEKQPQHSTLWYLTEALRQALLRAGIGPGDVDGLAVSSFTLAPDNTATLAEELGLTLTWGYSGAFGGASHVIGLLRAARAIELGEASVVVVVSGDSYSLRDHEQIMQRFNTGMRDYLIPYGVGGTNGLFAMLERRHRHEHGTTREQLGKLAVTQRANAVLNPAALLRQPLTLDEYLDARPICEPLRLYDCVLPCGGAEAVVLVSEAIGRQLGRPLIHVLGGSERTNCRPGDLLLLAGGWSEVAAETFGGAQLSPRDVHMVQLYDDYPIMEVVQLEGLGFCELGAGGRFLEATDISRAGSLPINTGGGQLSCGQCGAGGGGLGLTEAVTQLQHEAGERQLERAETCLVTGFGMVGYVKGLCQAAVLLGRD